MNEHSFCSGSVCDTRDCDDKWLSLWKFLCWKHLVKIRKSLSIKKKTNFKDVSIIRNIFIQMMTLNSVTALTLHMLSCVLS